MKLLIIGHMRSGKDTLAEIRHEMFGMKHISSSMAAASTFIFEELKDKYGYSTINDCFDDRVNHRSEWYDLIKEYNKDDKARLAKDILEESDCYVGMRSEDEIQECMNQELFDLIIWVDASERCALEPSSSFNIDISCADIVINNNQSFDVFKLRAIRLGDLIFNNCNE